VVEHPITRFKARPQSEKGELDDEEEAEVEFWRPLLGDLMLLREERKTGEFVGVSFKLGIPPGIFDVGVKKLAILSFSAGCCYPQVSIEGNTLGWENSGGRADGG
jgi:hypothetical protein